MAGGLGTASDGASLSAPRLLGRWTREGDRMVIEMAPWPGQRLMQRYPPLRMERTVEGHSHPWTSLFDDRVLGVVRVISCYSYEGTELVCAQRCTISVLMESNWPGGTGGNPLVGCSRNRINLEKKKG